MVKIRLSCSKETDDPVVEAMQSSDQTNFVSTNKTSVLKRGCLIISFSVCIVPR